ncbi:phosphotransferase [Patescibacteria group bacterium]|nr:phosphotransferase [Patescibacteria group bacterium]
MNSPRFISDPNYCRRLFLPYKKKVNKRAKTILSVKAKRLGGFLDRSYHIRYSVLVKKIDGKKETLAFHALSSPDPTRFQSWRVMDYLWKRNFSSGNYSIPEPLAFLKKHSMVITREIKGESFFEILEKKSFQEIFSALKKSARWLKKLHKTLPYRFQDVFSLSYFRAKQENKVLAKRGSYSQTYWQEQLRILKEGYPGKLKFLKKVINEIVDWENRNRKSTDRVITHHDFHPKNIFLGGRKVWVLDFSESRLSRKIIDIFTFLCQLDLINRQLLKRFSLDNLKDFSKIFLKEYFGQNWNKVLKDPILRKDFIILRKRIAAQSLVGCLLFKTKPKIFSNIIFGKTQDPLCSG